MLPDALYSAAHGIALDALTGDDNMQARVYEDMSGNLHIALDTGETVSNIPGRRGQLLPDLRAVADWLPEYQRNYPDDCNALDLDESGAPLYMALIAETAEGVISIYPDQMGVAGLIYAGLDE